jgi:hypothetical protein
VTTAPYAADMAAVPEPPFIHHLREIASGAKRLPTTRARKHHYVPSFLLARWATPQARDGRLVSLEVASGEVTDERPHNSSPIVTEVVRFEDLPLGSRGTRRAIARWSDGSESEALTWYADEILVCEGDHGNSRLMSPRDEMRRAAGSVRAPRGT